MRCEAVTFANRDGLRLFGIVHQPVAQRRRPVPVILLSPGIKSRVAPHRMYVKLARHLASLGFLVLRFDFAGLGDSEGVVSETTTADFYGTVQSGRYVDDTRAAMDWMQHEYGASKFILAGLCGGAITGLLAGAHDARVDALVALGLPVLLDSKDVDPTKYLTRGELDQWREGYKSKLADPRSWLRLLTLRSNYRVIVQVIANWWSKQRPQQTASVRPPQPPADNFNPLVPGAFEAMISSRRVLLVFGEADRLFPIYEERLAQPYAALLQLHRRNVDVQIVPGANHTFSLAVWEEAMRNRVDAWLEGQHDAARPFGSRSANASTRCGRRCLTAVSGGLAMKRRILHVEGCRDGTVGGSHVCLLRMLANLDRERFDPSVVLYADNHVAAALRAMNVGVYTLGIAAPVHLASRLGTLEPAARLLALILLPVQKLINFTWHFLRPAVAHARFLRAGKFDLVHLNNSINSNHDWMLGARLARVRLVSHERGVSETLSPSARLLGGWADRHVCVSHQVRETLVRNGIRAERAVVVYDGIDPELMRPARDAREVKAAFGIPQNAPVIGVVGNLKRWKGQETVIRATALLSATWPDIRCLLVGGAAPGDPYPGELQRLASSLGVEHNVVLTGFQRCPADLINAMDVVVHSSITPEPFGLVNIEAMFLRKPVVATRLGGPTEIFDDGRNGFLVDPSDPEALAEKVAMLLADPVLRKDVGELAYATVMEKFTITDTLRGIERVYMEVCR